MRRLESLEVGAKFRPSHPDQLDVRGRLMRGWFFLEKIFPTEPHLRICIQNGQKYSLSPDTIVSLPKEPETTAGEAEAYYADSIKPKSVDRARRHHPRPHQHKEMLVGYDVATDDVLDGLRSKLSDDQTKYMMLVKLTGKSRILPDEAKEILVRNVKHFRSKSAIDIQFKYLVSKLEALGLFVSVRGPRPLKRYERFMWGHLAKD